jgi:hypothetical protein
MSFLLGVVVGGLAMWTWRDVVREGVSKTRAQCDRGRDDTAGTPMVNATEQGREF